MRIIFVGTQKIGYDSLKAISNHQIVTVVTSRPDKHETWKDDISVYAKLKNIPVIYDNLFDAKLVKRLKPDIIVVVGFRKIIKDEILKIPKYGTIGLHASLLPKYKGNAPLNYAILSGEKETGITLFQITKGVDSGDILGQKKTRIRKNEYVDSLKKRVFNLGVKLLSETLNDFSNVKYQKQERDDTFYCKRTPEDSLINWNDATENIMKLIRASEKDYPSFGYWYDDKVFILRAKTETKRYVGSVGQIGDILPNGDVIILTSDGSLRVSKIKYRGKISKPSKILNRSTRLKNYPFTRFEMAI